MSKYYYYVISNGQQAQAGFLKDSHPLDFLNPGIITFWKEIDKVVYDRAMASIAKRLSDEEYGKMMRQANE